MESLKDVQRNVYKPNKGPPMLLLADDHLRQPKRKRRKVGNKYTHWIPPKPKDLPLSNFPASQLPEGFPPELSFRALAAYSFLRTVSCELRLSPFTPNAFLRALYLPYPNKLLGQIHASLLRLLLATLNMGYSCKQKGNCTPEVVLKKRRADGIRWPLRAGDNLTFLDNFSWPLFYDDYVHLTADVLWALMNDDENHADFRNIGLPNLTGMVLEEDLIEQEQEESLMAPAKMTNHAVLDDTFGESLGRGSRAAARRGQYAYSTNDSVDSDDESFKETIDEGQDNSDDEDFYVAPRKRGSGRKRGRPRKTKMSLPKSTAAAKGNGFSHPGSGAFQAMSVPSGGMRPGTFPMSGQMNFPPGVRNNLQMGGFRSPQGQSLFQSPQGDKKSSDDNTNGFHTVVPSNTKRSPRKLPMHKGGSPQKKKVKVEEAENNANKQQNAYAEPANSSSPMAYPGNMQQLQQLQLQQQQRQQQTLQQLQFHQQAMQNAQMQAMIAQHQAAMMALQGKRQGAVSNFSMPNQEFQINNAMFGGNYMPQVPSQNFPLFQQPGLNFATRNNNNNKFYPQSMRTPTLPHSAPEGARKHKVTNEVSDVLHNFIAGKHFKPKQQLSGQRQPKDGVTVTGVEAAKGYGHFYSKVPRAPGVTKTSTWIPTAATNNSQGKPATAGVSLLASSTCDLNAEENAVSGSQHAAADPANRSEACSNDQNLQATKRTEVSDKAIVGHKVGPGVNPAPNRNDCISGTKLASIEASSLTLTDTMGTDASSTKMNSGGNVPDEVDLLLRSSKVEMVEEASKLSGAPTASIKASASAWAGIAGTHASLNPDCPNDADQSLVEMVEEADHSQPPSQSEQGELNATDVPSVDHAKGKTPTISIKPATQNGKNQSAMSSSLEIANSQQDLCPSSPQKTSGCEVVATSPGNTSKNKDGSQETNSAPVSKSDSHREPIIDEDGDHVMSSFEKSPINSNETGGRATSSDSLAESKADLDPQRKEGEEEDGEASHLRLAQPSASEEERVKAVSMDKVSDNAHAPGLPEDPNSESSFKRDDKMGVDEASTTEQQESQGALKKDEAPKGSVAVENGSDNVPVAVEALKRGKGTDETTNCGMGDRGDLKPAESGKMETETEKGSDQQSQEHFTTGVSPEADTFGAEKPTTCEAMKTRDPKPTTNSSKEDLAVSTSRQALVAIEASLAENLARSAEDPSVATIVVPDPVPMESSATERINPPKDAAYDRSSTPTSDLGAPSAELGAAKGTTFPAPSHNCPDVESKAIEDINSAMGPTDTALTPPTTASAPLSTESTIAKTADNAITVPAPNVSAPSTESISAENTKPMEKPRDSAEASLASSSGPAPSTATANSPGSIQPTVASKRVSISDAGASQGVTGYKSERCNQASEHSEQVGNKFQNSSAPAVLGSANVKTSSTAEHKAAVVDQASSYNDKSPASSIAVLGDNVQGEQSNENLPLFVEKASDAPELKKAKEVAVPEDATRHDMRKNTENQLQPSEGLNSSPQQSAQKAVQPKTPANEAGAILSKNSHAVPSDDKTAVQNVDESVQSEDESVCFADQEEQWPQFRPVRSMRSGVPYHRLPLEEKLIMLEFLIDEILTVDAFAAEFQRRNITSLYPTPYGSLPSKCELENPENEDECAVCKGEGDLLCCDGCLSSYHRGCIDMKQNEELPEGRWLCPECELVDPVKFGPLKGGKKSSLDWFTGEDIKTAERNRTHAEDAYAASPQGEFGLLTDVNEQTEGPTPTASFKETNGEAMRRDQATEAPAALTQSSDTNVQELSHPSDKKQYMDACSSFEASATRSGMPSASFPNDGNLSGNATGVSVAATATANLGAEAGASSSSDIDAQTNTTGALNGDSADQSVSTIMPMSGGQHPKPAKELENEYLVVHGFVFARPCDRNRDSRVPLSDIESEASVPLNTEQLSEILKSFGPDLSLAWPLAQIPFSALEDGGPVVERDIQHPKIDNYFSSKASYDPSFYVSKYRKTPLSKVMFPGAGFQSTQLLLSEYENACNNCSVRRLSDRLSPRFDGDSSLAQSLKLETSLFDPYQLIKDYMLKLENLLNRANLLQEFWGTRSKELKANVWQTNVRSCQSIPRLAGLLLKLIDATHRRAFSEQWFAIAGHKESAETPSETAEGLDTKSFLPLADDWSPEAELRKRRWERTPLASVRSVLFKEGRTVEDWVYGDDREILQEVSGNRRKRKQGNAGRSTSSPERNSHLPGKVARKSFGDQECLPIVKATPNGPPNLDPKLLSVQKLQQVIEKRVITGINSEVEKQHENAAEPLGDSGLAESVPESGPANPPKAKKSRSRTRRSSRVTKKQETPEDFLNSVIENSGKSQNELSMETVIEARKMAKLVEVKEQASAAPFVDTLKWPICGRLLFPPIGTLSAAEMKRLGRNAGGIMAQNVSYTGNYEVGEVSHFHVWRKNLQRCVSYEQLLLQIRVLESYIERSVVQICETFAKRTPSAKASVPKVIKCTQRDLLTGIDHHFVIQKSKNRGCWVSSQSIDLSPFVLDRSERRDKHVAAFNNKLRAKQLAEMKAREAERAKKEAEARARAEEFQRQQEAARQKIAREQAAAREKARREKAEAKAAKEAAKAKAREEKEAAKRAQAEKVQQIYRQTQQALHEHKVAAAQLIQQAARAGLATVSEPEIQRLRKATFARLQEYGRLLGKASDTRVFAQQIQMAEQDALTLGTTQRSPPAEQRPQQTAGPQSHPNVSRQQQAMGGRERAPLVQQQTAQHSQYVPQTVQRQTPPQMVQRQTPSSHHSLQPISNTLQMNDVSTSQMSGQIYAYGHRHASPTSNVALDSRQYGSGSLHPQTGQGSLAAPATQQTHLAHMHPSAGTVGHLHGQNPHHAAVSATQRGHRGEVDHHSNHRSPYMSAAMRPSHGSHEDQPHRYVRQTQQPLNSGRRDHSADQLRGQLLQVLRDKQNKPQYMGGYDTQTRADANAWNTTPHQEVQASQLANLAMFAGRGAGPALQDVQGMTSQQQSTSNADAGLSPAQQYQDLLARHGYSASTPGNARPHNAMNGSPTPATFGHQDNNLGYSNNARGSYGQGHPYNMQNQQQSPNAAMFDIEPTPIEQMTHHHQGASHGQSAQQQQQQQQIQQQQQQQRYYQPHHQQHPWY